MARKARGDVEVHNGVEKFDDTAPLSRKTAELPTNFSASCRRSGACC